ncbi:hypothetical protein [Brevundimonas sp.]|uniref:hypothetical protein n=1 Tax=Brevundimonas sp. TaxID=1871086 RepID=UPI002AC946E3|nr:hypothetical protein [Brevundimonas sp.]
MPTRRMGGLDRARPESRRNLETSPFSARAAGLYSEVVWDRSRAMPIPEERSAATRADRPVPPTE